MKNLQLGIDVGGTFTDFVLYNQNKNEFIAWKVLSTKENPVKGIVNGLEKIERISEIGNIRLGTTIATNALLERKGAKLAYITTKGFKDVPFIQRGHRRSHYDMTWIKQKPLVERRYCFEINERIDRDKNIVKELNYDDLTNIIKNIKKHNIESIAINLIFSYLNPINELKVKKYLEKHIDIPISISYEVLPRWKEYERASTTIADAYIKNIVSKQLSNTEKSLVDVGSTKNIVIIKSNGGEMSIDMACKKPIETTVSGPTGGVVAAKYISENIDEKNIVTIDMGGTSTDCSTIVDGNISFTTSFELEWGLPIQIPMIDIRTIGAGGGSIAWVDKGGLLRVGPQSSGSNPGPACYGIGGIDSTVTDANLCLNRLNPKYFLGGTMNLDITKSKQALNMLSKKLNSSILKTSNAIIKIANNNMVSALRSLLIEKGLDPRDFTLLCFGGAGPLHAGDLLSELNFKKAIIPNNPGQFSALGFLVTDPRVDRQRTVQLNSKNFKINEANKTISDLLTETKKELNEQGYRNNLKIKCSLEMRYSGQNYELSVPIKQFVFTNNNIENIWNEFHKMHKIRFGFNIPGQIIEIVTFNITGIYNKKKPKIAISGKNKIKLNEANRDIYFENKKFKSKIFNRSDMFPGFKCDGPIAVEEEASVTLIHPYHKLSVDNYNNLIITKR